MVLLSLKPFYHRSPGIPGLLLIAGGLLSGCRSNLGPFHCFQIKCTMVASCGLKLGRATPSTPSHPAPPPPFPLQYFQPPRLIDSFIPAFYICCYISSETPKQAETLNPAGCLQPSVLLQCFSSSLPISKPNIMTEMLTGTSRFLLPLLNGSYDNKALKFD